VIALFRNLPPGARAGMIAGIAAMYLVPGLFALIGAWPLRSALAFPDRAIQAEATVSGAEFRNDEPVAYRVSFTTAIGGRMETSLPATHRLDYPSTVTLYYDPLDPRFVRLERDVTLGEAMDGVGDRLIFAWFGLGFMALVTVMLTLASVQLRREARQGERR